MDFTAIISAIVAAVFSSLGTIVTIRSTKKKGELDNVQEAITIWRETAEKFAEQLKIERAEKDEIVKQIEALRCEVTKLRGLTSRVLKLLDRITPENVEVMKSEIKNELHNEGK